MIACRVMANSPMPRPPSATSRVMPAVTARPGRPSWVRPSCRSGHLPTRPPLPPTFDVLVVRRTGSSPVVAVKASHCISVRAAAHSAAHLPSCFVSGGACACYCGSCQQPEQHHADEDIEVSEDDLQAMPVVLRVPPLVTKPRVGRQVGILAGDRVDGSEVDAR